MATLQEKETTAVQVGVMKGGGASSSMNGEEECCEYTLDGSVDIKGRPAIKGRTGGWIAGTLILGNFFPLYFQVVISGNRNKSAV